MFTFTRPPQYSIDAAATWIHPKDPAWDTDRIDAEIKKMAEAEPPIEEDRHPVRRWGVGETAFDIDASISDPGVAIGSVTAREYLDGTETVFTIRPLETVRECMAYAEAQGDELAEMVRRVVSTNLVKIQVSGEDVPLHRSKAGVLDEQSMSMLYHSEEGSRLLLHYIAGAICRLGNGATKKP